VHLPIMRVCGLVSLLKCCQIVSASLGSRAPLRLRLTPAVEILTSMSNLEMEREVSGEMP
jgi:hypothetical protein